ncbi:MAG: helix-turn-helix domain-containing protein [Planctomycetota bacterium]|nr:helix-turn-helix domain-containing protein [Planctomycetota bacterium]
MSLTFLTIDEVVSMLRLSRDTVYRLAKSGELPGKKVGRTWRFVAEEIESYVAREFSDGEHAKRVRAQYAVREDVLEETIRERNEELLKINRQLKAEITERHQTEAYLRAVFESVGDGLIVVDANYRMVLFNKAAEAILGTGETSAEPESWPATYGIYLPDGETPCPAIELPLVRAVQGERVDHAEFVIRNAFLPEPVWVACRATPVLDDNGVLKGGVVVFHDITARKRAEEEFRLSEQRLQNLLDCLPQMTIAPAPERRQESPSSGVVVSECLEQLDGWKETPCPAL